MPVKERKRVEVKAEEHLGLVQLGGDGLPAPKSIALTPVGGCGIGHALFQPVQVASKYGVPMAVPAGKYDLWMQPAEGGIAEKLEEKLEVKAGELTTIE